jgi:hypothetical protein
MSKKFKNFRKKNRFDDDEWGSMNEDRIREKQRSKKRKLRENENRKQKHMNFKDFRDG